LKNSINNYSKNCLFSDKYGNTFRIIPAPPQLGLELTASLEHIRSEGHALQLQIKKWELLHEQCCQGVLLDDGGIGTSALCQLYFFSYPDQCADCPVSLTGHPACKGTPYWDYQDALEVNNLPLAKLAAEEEIEFLEGLIHEE